MPIIVDLDVEMANRKVNMTELCRRVGITPANLSVLKNGRCASPPRDRFDLFDLSRWPSWTAS